MPACMRSGQVAHVDLAKAWDADTVRDAINAHLRPHPVAVLAAEARAPKTSTRAFRRAQRHYLYRIINRRADLALDAGARLARAAAARRGGHARRPPSGWSASTISPPSAPPNARRNRR